MIQVGIHDNIELVKAELNDKKTLVIGIKKGQGLSLAERLSSGSDESSAEDGQDFFIWPVQLGEYTKTGADVARDMESLTRMLKHILKGYIKEDEIAKNSNPFNGVDIANKTDSEIETMLITPTVIEKMYNNIVAQFIEMISPFIGKGLLFRCRLNRQSKAKHFSSFPKVGKFANLDTEGFWEPMDVVIEATSVAYSNYELGFRKGDKTTPSGVDLSSSKSVVEASEASEEEAKAAAEMFGGKAEE